MSSKSTSISSDGTTARKRDDRLSLSLKRDLSLSESERIVLQALLVDDGDQKIAGGLPSHDTAENDTRLGGVDKEKETSFTDVKRRSGSNEKDGDQGTNTNTLARTEKRKDIMHKVPISFIVVPNLDSNNITTAENNGNNRTNDDEHSQSSPRKQQQQQQELLHPPTLRRDSSFHIGLWKSYEEGIKPRNLVDEYSRRSSSGVDDTSRSAKRILSTEDDCGTSSRAMDQSFKDNFVFVNHDMMSDDKKDGVVRDVTSIQKNGQEIVSKDASDATKNEGDDNDSSFCIDSTRATIQPKDSLLDGEYSIQSDKSVRLPLEKDTSGDAVAAPSHSSSASSASSWDINDGGFDHYDAWQLLKDEYAADFGYAFGDSIRPKDDVPEGEQNNSNVIGVPPQQDDGEFMFKILGTCANDVECQPHVLSPPLMESLLSFVPEELTEQNLLLKFSLVRDGASIIALQEMVKHSSHTILAIETTNGEVFGGFTSMPWKRDHSYYGTGEAFLWKMRHSRLWPCHSIYEQAQLEGEIDVFPFSGLNYYVQLCTSDKLAMGGGELLSLYDENRRKVQDMNRGSQDFDPQLMDDLQQGAAERENANHIVNGFGFGIALNSDLLFGTSSPCATFRNPSLSTHSENDDMFEVVNLEVWTFTPCLTLQDAERLEEMKSFREDSVRQSIDNFNSDLGPLCRPHHSLHNTVLNLGSGDDRC